MENTRIHRRQKSPTKSPLSPHLVRSKSRPASAAIMLPENRSCKGSTSNRSIVAASISVTRSRSKKNEENVNPLANCGTKERTSSQESRENFFNYFNSPRNLIGSTMTKRSKSISCTSPSAWALSPGRSSWVQTKPPECSTPEPQRFPSGGVGGVLKYFRQKKVSQIQEKELHKFKVLSNRLLQMRFINLKAETTIKDSKLATEDKLFTIWLRNLRTRNSNVEKKIQIQKLKNEIRVYMIIYPHISLLNQWAKLERRNQESVGSLVRAFTGLSLKLPLIHGAKGDVNSLYQALTSAEKAMNNIQTVTINYLFQPIEKILYVATERLSMFKEEEEWLDQMEKAISFTSALLVKERSLRVELMQLQKKSKAEASTTSTSRGEDDTLRRQLQANFN